MGPYSMDLRERVIAAVDAHEGSLRQLARRYRIGTSTITRWRRRRRRWGTIAPRPHGGGHPPALDAAARCRLRAAVRKQPAATLQERAQHIGVRCSRMALFRTLKKLRISRKKKAPHARQRDSARVRRLRRLFGAPMAQLDPSCLVLVDETGATTAMTRTYGRAPIGPRVQGTVPGPGKSVTLIGGLRLCGVVAAMAFEGAMDTAHFRAYVEPILRPQLRPGDVVIWDNLKPHQDAQARQAVEGAQAQVDPLPPYSPDRTPIEERGSKVKGVRRSIGARVVPAVDRAMKVGLESVTPRDILGWFQHCGLCPVQS